MPLMYRPPAYSCQTPLQNRYNIGTQISLILFNNQYIAMEQQKEDKISMTSMRNAATRSMFFYFFFLCLEHFWYFIIV